MRPLQRFAVNQVPTRDELSTMLNDLRIKVGSWRMLEIISGVEGAKLRVWTHKQCSQAARRYVWLLWCVICRPGAVQTTFDLATLGRFTKFGNPATAGKWQPLRPVKVPPPTDFPVMPEPNEERFEKPPFQEIPSI